MKTYFQPAFRVHEVNLDELMQNNSLNDGKPTQGLTTGDGDTSPGYGGENDGSHDVGAKEKTFNVWDE